MRFRGVSLFVAMLVLVLTVQASSALEQSPNGVGMSPVSPAPEEHLQGNAKDNYDRPQEFSFPVRIIEDHNESEHRQWREAQSDQYEKATLEEQRRAADGAEISAMTSKWQVYIAVLELLLTLFGTLGLFWSLYFTRKGLAAAVRAAEAAEAGLVSQVRVERGRVVLSGVTFAVDNSISGTSTDRVKFSLLNVGRTAIYGVEGSIFYGCLAALPDVPPPGKELSTIDINYSLLPEKELTFGPYRLETTGHRKSRSGDHTKYLVFACVYNDVFGNKYAFGFCRSVLGEGLFRECGGPTYNYDYQLK